MSGGEPANERGDHVSAYVYVFAASTCQGDFRCRRGGAALPLRLEPALEHQHHPEAILFVDASTEVRVPHAADRLGVEIALVAEAPLVEQLLRPITERASKPVVD